VSFPLVAWRNKKVEFKLGFKFYTYKNISLLNYLWNT
jgi:hypothetical protein